MTDFEGGLSEAYCIGDRTPNVTEIGTKQLILEKNTKYTFYFWVKIERSPKNEAVCQLQIVYNGDFENKRVYVLSNGNIRASKTVEGWQLFEIPFVTEENEYTQLRFFAKNAQCSIIPGREASNYASLKDDKTAYGNTSQGQDTAGESETSDEQNPFKNISFLLHGTSGNRCCLQLLHLPSQFREKIKCDGEGHGCSFCHGESRSKSVQNVPGRRSL